MAQLLWEIIVGQPSELAQRLLMTECLPTGGDWFAVTLSGGVGECFRHHDDDNPFRFGDIGPLLAQAIRRHEGFAALPMQIPNQTVRATVIGAGAHTLSLSGSTIWLDDVTLPLRNVPVVQPQENAALSLVARWQQALLLLDLNAEQDLYALALPATWPVNAATVRLSIAALQSFTQLYPSVHPLLVIASQDIGKALGMLLRPLMAQRRLAVIDEVITHTGDYIDIGTPLFNGAVVPITVKSLAFPS